MCEDLGTGLREIIAAHVMRAGYGFFSRTALHPHIKVMPECIHCIF